MPLNVHVLTALREDPLPLVDLRRAIGSPPQTTMRGALRTLSEFGILERRREHDFPGSVDYELGRPGRELLAVAEITQNWLDAAPGGAAEMGGIAAKSAIKALAEGWSSMVVRALAAKPLSLTELNRLIPGITYPSLERRLTAMRLADQIEACERPSRGTPYTVTNWTRRGIAPLASSASWERSYMRTKAQPIAKIDVEAAFLLAVPLLQLPPEHSGVCRLVVELGSSDSGHRLAGLMATVREGRVISCTSRLQGEATASAAGSTQSWLSAVIDNDTDALETGGDTHLAVAMLEELNGTLFRVRQRS